MAASRAPMRKLRDVLRLTYDRKLPQRAIAQACGLGLGTVTTYLQRATVAGLSWPLPDDLDDGVLEAPETDRRGERHQKHEDGLAPHGSIREELEQREARQSLLRRPQGLPAMLSGPYGPTPGVGLFPKPRFRN